ncbi:MAG: cytochrome c-type biogenesis protein [Micropepsaceae bacterium]
MRKIAIAFITLVAFFPGISRAVEPEEMLGDPALEARAREITRELRCVVCQNQSIDDSNADLARDMRVLVRERLKKGDTNEQTLAYLVARYGNYVLLKPPLQLDTALLWFSPILFLGLGVLLLRGYFRTMRTAPASQTPLSQSEQDALEHIAEEG